jgi:FkbH-like protein
MTLLTPKELMRRKQKGEALLASAGEQAGSSKIAVLSSFNLDTLPSYLAEALERKAIKSRAWVSPFGQIPQTILAPDSELYDYAPDIIFLFPAVEDLLGQIFDRPGRLAHEAQMELVEQRLGEVESWVQRLLDSLAASTVFLVTFGTDRAPGTQILSPDAPERGQEAVAHFLDGVRRLGRLSPRLRVADWDWEMRVQGWAALQDPRLWYLGRMRLNPLGTAHLADFLAQHLGAERAKIRKVAVLDLDNTLWGGVVGEDGIQGLHLGNEGVGLAFQDLQRELLKWHDAGVLLAICSKNNPEDALAVFDNHPDMLLKRDHFAAIRINWTDKAQNIKELAEELDLGLDSFVFLDDNQVERDWVAQALPEVLVPDLPRDPAERPCFLRSTGLFLRFQVTDTDRSRIRSYQARRRRDDLRSSSASLEDFYRYLEQQVEIRPLSQATLARAAQMVQRTNQFNLTTRRYSAAELERMMKDPQCELFTLSVRDRYDDSGITGMAILRQETENVEIDSLLLSCRVLGRRIEDAFLAFLVGRARSRGGRALLGRYVPTAKNGQVARFFESRGFVPVSEDGVSRLDLVAGPLPQIPDFIHLNAPEGMKP